MGFLSVHIICILQWKVNLMNWYWYWIDIQWCFLLGQSVAYLKSFIILIINPPQHSSRVFNAPLTTKCVNSITPFDKKWKTATIMSLTCWFPKEKEQMIFIQISSVLSLWDLNQQPLIYPNPSNPLCLLTSSRSKKCAIVSLTQFF